MNPPNTDLGVHPGSLSSGRFRCTIAVVCLLAAGVSLAEEIRLKEPQGVIFDARDHLFIADTGNHRVLEFAFSDASPTANLSLVRTYGDTKAGAGPGQLNRPLDVAVDNEHERVYVADSANHRIAVFDLNGKFERAFGAEGRNPGQFVLPTNVTLDGQGRVIVTDRPSDRLQIFDADGKLISNFENRSGPRTADETAQILAYNRMRNPNAKPEDVGSVWRREDPGQLHEPGGVWLDGETNRLYVANGWNCRIEILDYDPQTGTLKRRPPESGIAWGFWVNHGVAGTADGGLLGVQTAWGTVRKFKNRGQIGPKDEPTVDVEPGVWGRISGLTDIAVAPQSGRVALADSQHDRVVIYPASLETGTHPWVDQIKADSARIEFQTMTPTDGIVRYRENPYPRFTDPRFVKSGYGVERELRLGKGTQHEIRLSDLKPATRYYFRLWMPGVRQIPDDGWSREYAISTRAEPGRVSFIRMPVRIMLLANVYATDSLPDDASAADVPQPEPMSASDITRFYEEQFRQTQVFYWVNSRMQYFIDFDFMVDKAPYRKGPVRDSTPAWLRALPELNADASWKKMLEETHHADDLYCGDVVCEAEQRWDAAKKSWIFQGSGGGTYGVEWPTPARSHFLGGGDVAWLFAHEFKHQFESQYGLSGLDREDDRNWFCHFSPKYDDPATEAVEWKWDTAAKHGEHWDGVAWQLRNFTPDQYRRNCWGWVGQAVDDDNDGIPGNAPELPLDEKRLRSNRQSQDSESDGLKDMDELMASTWVRALLTDVRKRVEVAYTKPGIFKPDGDDDHVFDAKDRHPIYPFDPNIPRGTIDVDGDLSDWGPAETRPMPNTVTFVQKDLGPAKESVDLQIRTRYDDAWLYFGIVIRTPHAGLTLVTDNNSDGFFVGNDNVLLTIKPSGQLDNVRLHLGANNRWPYFDDQHEILKPEEIRIASHEADGVQTIELALPRRVDIGLELTPGEKIGWLMNCTLPSGAEVAVFEPYWFFEATLAAPPAVRR